MNQITWYNYALDGKLTRMRDANNHITRYEYDANGRRTTTIFHDDSYTLDAAGNRTKVVEHTGRTVEYTYDDTYKLLEEKITNPDSSVSVISYTYDKVGNRKTKTENGFTTTYQYNENNQLVIEDDITYSYDDNGNLKAKNSAEENIKYYYDAENHLIKVETTRFGVTIVVEYEYDAEGNRVRKVLDGTIVTTYLVDANRDYVQVLEERDGSGNLLVRYVYGHDLISQERPSTGSGRTVSYYHYDGLGSTRALTASSEAVTDTYTYDAFGNLLDKRYRTGSTINPYLYRGEQYDDDLNAYYLRARYYQPGIGRFLTTDPVEGFPNNPISYIDPSGKWGLADTLGTVAILNIVSTIAISDIWGPNNPIQKVYAYLGEHFFPGAHILGITGYISHDLLSFINTHFTFPPSNATWFYSKALGYVVGGLEVVMNIGSGQVSLFATAGFGGEFSPRGISYKPPIGYKPITGDIEN